MYGTSALHWSSRLPLHFIGVCRFVPAAGATAFVSQTGLGNDKLWVCNLTSGNFTNCLDYSGFSTLRASFASGDTVW